MNNPLAYTDASGENWGWVWWIVGGVAGGAINVAQNWDNIDNFGEGFAYFNVGGLAGSGAAVLADNGVGGPGIGMFYNWITNTGNGLIEGNSTDEIITSGTQGAIWGGISGFAMEGLAAGINGLMNMPVNVKSGSGYIEPFTHRPQTTQITFGEWLFGSSSGSISNIIAAQGVTNTKNILAAQIAAQISGDVLGPSGDILGESVDNFLGIKGLTAEQLYWYSPAVRAGYDNRGGMVLNLSYTDQNSLSGYQWTQKYSKNGGPWMIDNTYRGQSSGSIFYYSLDELVNQKRGNKIFFYDNPCSPSKNVEFRFILGLYKHDKPILHVYWGYFTKNGITSPLYPEIIP